LNYQKRVLFLIAVSTILRSIISCSLELSNTEVYYWTFARHLQWNYFDHPPIVAWLIRLTTLNLLLQNEFFVRLGAIIASAICTWLIFTVGIKIRDERTGWFAALLYTASIYGSIATGAFILPDSPQMVFWLAGFWTLLSISHQPAGDSKLILLWSLFGVFTGLCIMCKVHGIFLWLGMILYALLFNRSWFKYSGIYLSSALTLLIASPIVFWNLQNHFASYTFHSSRVTLMNASFDPGLFVKQLLGTILITNPINFFLICYSLFLAFKTRLPILKKDLQVILCCSLPLISILLFISFFRETYAHWSGPGFSMLLLLPAVKLASDETIKRLITNQMKWALGFCIIFIFSEIMITWLYPGTVSNQKDGLNIGKGDFSLDMYGWKDTGRQFDSFYRRDIFTKKMPINAPIIVTRWFPAAHLDYYIGSKTKQQTIGMGDIFDLHEYYWTNKYKTVLKPGDSAYYVIPSNLFDYKTLDRVINRFSSYEMPLVISQFRNGSVCKQVYVFRLKGYIPGEF
jgi:hypothetical protein